MTYGWGEVARACWPKGALAIHFKYDGASMLFVKVFDKDGQCLECCSVRGSPRGAAMGAELAPSLAGNSSSSSNDLLESSDSPEPNDSLEYNDDSYVPSSSRCAHSAAAASARRCR